MLRVLRHTPRGVLQLNGIIARLPRSAELTAEGGCQGDPHSRYWYLGPI